MADKRIPRDLLETGRSKEDDRNRRGPKNERRLERMINTEKVLNLKAQGKLVGEIAAAVFGEDHASNRRKVYTYIDRAANKVRENIDSFLKAAFITSNERLELLWRKAYEHALALGTFDTDLWKTLLAIVDRQSRLLGIDRGGDNRGKPIEGFLDSAPPSQIVSRLESLGVSIPAHLKGSAKSKDAEFLASQAKGASL